MGKKQAEEMPFDWEPLRRRYRFSIDDSYRHEQDVSFKRENKRFYERILTHCGGFIGLSSENPHVLIWWTPNKSKTVSKVYEKFKDVPGFAWMHYQGFEAELLFPATHIKKVLSLAGARTQRQLSEEEKLKASERFRVYRERKKTIDESV
jgi:hypothetical protein